MEGTPPAAVETSAATAPGAVPEASAAEQTPAAEQLSVGQKLLNLLGLGSEKSETIPASTPANTPTEAGVGAGANNTPTVTVNQEKAFTQADLDAAVAKALADKDEADRLAKLPPEEKAKAEAEAQKKEIAGLQAQLLQRDLKQTAVATLDQAGYPVALADMLDYTSKESMEKSLTAVQETFKSSLEAALKEKLRGKTPAGLGDAGGSEGAIRDQIAQNIRGGLN